MPQPSDATADPARPPLTPRERVVLLAVGQRLANGEIADLLKVSKRTVESHIASLFAKFGVQKRLDLVALAVTDSAESPPAGLVGTNGLMWRELTKLRRQVLEFTEAAHTQRTLEWASGVLLERYRLPHVTVAARLLRTVARQHGLTVADLAGALLAAPRPDDTNRPWFPRRDWRREPELAFLPETVSDLPQVLSAALDASRGCADSAQGDLQLAQPGGRGLDIVEARGFTDAFLAHFAHVDGKATACALALSTKEAVSIPDVTRSEIYESKALAALDAERVRTVHSTPMLTGQSCVGVVSVHRSRPNRVPSRATQGELERIAGQTGNWLAWHRRTARLDALEDLHQSARRYPATGDPA